MPHDFEGLDEYIRQAMESWNCPGVAVTVVKGDDLVYQSVQGFRDVEAQLPVTADTRFPLASVTKSFTAMTAALLVDEGKLEWDKPVREYIPEFILDDEYTTSHVTVRDLLSHRTGLPRHDLAAWRLDVSRAEFIKRMKHFKFSATFREKFQYNNLMYYAAAYLVESLAGQKWEDFVHERIFTPLGMTGSNFQPEPPQPGQPIAKGYRVDRDEEGGSKGLIELPFGLHTELSPGAAGALFSTLADLTQWLRVHVNDGRAGDTQLVSATNLKQMHLPHTVIPGGGIAEALHGNSIFTYGLGWFIEPYKGYTGIHHGGNVEGHSLVIGFVPQAKLGIVVLTNIAGLPLRDVLLYECFDRGLGLPAQDWNNKYHGVFDPMIVGAAKGKQTAAAERLTEAPPSHSLESYVGEYETDGYPDFAVRSGDGGLQARTVGSLDWSTLRHYHYDVFEWHLVDFDQWIKVRFLTSDEGDVDSLSVPIEPAVENIVFTRKQPVLTQELVEALLGNYQPPIDGMTLTVTARDGRVYVASTGGAPREMKAHKLSEDVISFRLERLRLDFVREGGAVGRLVYKAPGLTLEAPRN